MIEHGLGRITLAERDAVLKSYPSPSSLTESTIAPQSAAIVEHEQLPPPEPAA